MTSKLSISSSVGDLNNLNIILCISTWKDEDQKRINSWMLLFSLKTYLKHLIKLRK